MPQMHIGSAYPSRTPCPGSTAECRSWAAIIGMINLAAFVVATSGACAAGCSALRPWRQGYQPRWRGPAASQARPPPRRHVADLAREAVRTAVYGVERRAARCGARPCGNPSSLYLQLF